MDYAIIEKEMELAHSELPLDKKLEESARLLVSACPFDQCLVYLPEARTGGFVLKAVAGEEGAPQGVYGPGEGLVGVAARRKAHVKACIKEEGGPLKLHFIDGGATEGGEEITDPGLEGYRCTAAYPLCDKKAVHGVLLLRSREKYRIEGEAAELLKMAAMELTNIIKCAHLMRTHKEEHDKLKEMQDKLVNVEKLMALGDMAAILAHEVKNPIINLGGYISKIKKTVEADSTSMGYVEHMLEEIRRVEKIMNGVIRFLRDNAVELELDDANHMVEEALSIFHDEFKENDVKVIKDFYREPLPVWSDREQLKIAFDNLISNAIQSMVENPSWRGRTLKVATNRTEDSVIIKISDNGPGIDPRVRDYIFNPFFTTKERGTGLGLAITNSIIMRHKGVIDVDSEPGEGASFSIKLPYAEDKEAS